MIMRVDAVLHLLLAVALTVWIDDDYNKVPITIVESGNEDSRLVRSDNLSSVEGGNFGWNGDEKTQQPTVILTFNGTKTPLSDTHNDERGDSLFSLNSYFDRDSLHGCSYFGFSSTSSKFLTDRDGDGMTCGLTRNSSTTSDVDGSIALDMIAEQSIFMPWISTNTQLVTRLEAADGVSDVDRIKAGTTSSFATAACLTAFVVTLTVAFSRNNSMRHRKKCSTRFGDAYNCSGGHNRGKTFPSSPGVGRRRLRRISSMSKSPSSFSRRGRIEYEPMPMYSTPVKNTKTKRLIRSKTRSGTWKRVDIDM